MEFFDDKEEVIDIQLTQFGKYQLSLGKWKPVYYAFFDDNILYDAEYAGLDENQNNAEPRIQENTPQLHTQHVFSGRETDFLRQLDEKRDKDLREEDKIKIQSNAEKFYSLAAPLGTSDYGVKDYPRLTIQALEGTITDSKTQLTGSFRTQEIPQIEMDLTYRFNAKSIYDEERQDSYGQIDAEELGGQVFLDGTYFEMEEEQVIVNIQELNVPFDVENFEIEVFELPVSGNLQDIQQIYFQKQNPQIVNGILISDAPLQQDSTLDSNYVEYYFDINVDDEIDQNTLSRAITRLKSQGFYTDSEYRIIKPPVVATAANLYDDVTSIELVTCVDDEADAPPTARVTSRKPNALKIRKPFTEGE